MTERLVITQEDVAIDLTKPGKYTPEQVAEFFGATEQALERIQAKAFEELKTEDLYLVDSLVYQGASILKRFYEGNREVPGRTESASDYSYALVGLVRSGQMVDTETLPGLEEFGSDRNVTIAILDKVIEARPGLESTSPAFREDIMTLASNTVGMIRDIAVQQGGLLADRYVAEKMTPIKNGTNLVLAGQGQV